MDSIDIAVVISVKDDPCVVECVAAVLVPTAPFPFEVVVVDNGSRDDTPRLLSSRFQTNPSVKLLAQRGHLSEAWNTAAQTTTVSILVRIDADARSLPGWLDALTRPIRSGTADGSACPAGGVHADVRLAALC